MWTVRNVYRRIRALIWKNEIEQDMEEELRLHLQMRTEDNVASGMSTEEARRQAIRRFGNIERIKEHGRDIRGGGFMEVLIQDIRYGVRLLAKSPAFTLAAVLTLALGIGANTAIFSWLKALALDYMPAVERPQDLVALPGMNADGSGCCSGVSYPNLLDYQNRSGVFDGILGYEIINVNMRTQTDSMRVQGTIVTGNYFGVLRVKPFLGRAFLPDETQTVGTHAVAVISHSMWQRVFGADAGIVGREVSINGRPFTLIGVTPPEFGSAMVGLAFDLFIPVTMQPVVSPGSNMVVNRGSMWLDLMGRLKPGVTVERAREGILKVSRQLETEYPESGKDKTLGVFPLLQSPMGLQSEIVSVIVVMMAVVGLVLLIACANVSNLMLARAAVRQRETAVRLALGAGRARLVRQLLTESLILALAAGAVGVVVGAWTVRGMLMLVPQLDLPISFNVGMDRNVLLFTFGLSVLTGIMFGLLPGLRLSKTGVAPALKETSRSQTGRSRLRTVLVVGQVAVSVVLLICAGLFLRSLQSTYHADLGFNSNDTLMVSLDVFPNGYTPDQGRRFYAQLLEEVKALPGVESATLARRPPLSMRGARGTGLAEIEGYQPGPDEELGTIYDTVGTKYFETLQIPVIRGRGFTDEDRNESQSVVVVNENFAKRYWPNQDPIGKRIRRGDVWLEVVGMARNVKYREISESGRVYLYAPHQQVYEPDMTLLVRAKDPLSLTEPIRQLTKSIDKDLALFGIMPMSTHVGNAMASQLAAASGAGVFALLALVLAVIGIYGMISYSVSQRTQEIGVRMALGASRRDVYGLILGQGARSIAIGLGIGLAISAFLTRFLQGLLFGIRSSDPITFLGISALLLIAGMVACYIPARRATQVDPATALRHE